MSEEPNTLPLSINIPKKIKTIAKTLQFLSPNLAVKFAYKLFVTPVKYKIPEREKTLRKSAQKESVYVNDIEKNIDLISYGYSPKKVLLVHGWSGRATQFYMIADKLLENGYMIISFDAPAHGNSEGETANLIDFIESIKAINENYGPFESAVGHSLGGVALYNTANQLKLKSLVTIASPDKTDKVINRFVYNLGLKQKIAKKLKTYIDKIISTDCNSFSSTIQVQNINSPILIVHDTNDGDVPLNCAKNINKHAKNSSLLITENLSHTKILRDKTTAEKIVTFIKKQ